MRQQDMTLFGERAVGNFTVFAVLASQKLCSDDRKPILEGLEWFLFNLRRQGSIENVDAHRICGVTPQMMSSRFLQT